MAASNAVENVPVCLSIHGAHMSIHAVHFESAYCIDCLPEPGLVGFVHVPWAQKSGSRRCRESKGTPHEMTCCILMSLMLIFSQNGHILCIQYI